MRRGEGGSVCDVPPIPLPDGTNSRGPTGEERSAEARGAAVLSDEARGRRSRRRHQHQVALGAFHAAIEERVAIGGDGEAGAGNVRHPGDEALVAGGEIVIGHGRPVGGATD